MLILIYIDERGEKIPKVDYVLITSLFFIKLTWDMMAASPVWREVIVRNGTVW